jgi:hypothetical protein
MKLSISVPDALWEQASQPGASPSQVVQESLALLVAHKKSGEERVVTSAETRLNKSSDDAGWIAEKLDRLHQSATQLRDTGYRMGIEVATDLDWLLLEELPVGRELRGYLLEWANNGEEPWGIGDRLFQCLSDWEEGLDGAGEPVPSVSLYDGMAAGFDDVRDAIRERMRREFETGTSL